jgi:hypothetical protein
MNITANIAAFATTILMTMVLLDEQDLSLRVDRVVAPAHPVNTIAGGTAVIQVDLERASGKRGTAGLAGESPFLTSALNAVTHWEFFSSAGRGCGAYEYHILFQTSESASDEVVYETRETMAG